MEPSTSSLSIGEFGVAHWSERPGGSLIHRKAIYFRSVCVFELDTGICAPSHFGSSCLEAKVGGLFVIDDRKFTNAYYSIEMI